MRQAEHDDLHSHTVQDFESPMDRPVRDRASRLEHLGGFAAFVVRRT